MTLCTAFLTYCIVGGLQIGPSKYLLQVLETDTGVITDYVLPLPEELRVPENLAEI